jgi:hypothetical protein
VSASSFVELAGHLDQELVVVQLKESSHRLNKCFATREDIAVRTFEANFAFAATFASAVAFATAIAFTSFSDVLTMIVQLVALMES